MASSTMALARAFTKRAKRHHEETSAPSEGSFRYAAGTIARSKISLPTELLSTTNVHALNAPDIKSLSSGSSNASLRSADGSEFSSISRSFLSTPATSPEASSIESSPISPEPLQRKGFFDTTTSPKRSATTAGTRSSASTDSSDHPVLPQRALSHSKRAHQELARKRSSARLTPPPTIITNVTIIRNSAEIFGGAVDPNHPFGNELAQVNEVAEEFGGGDALLEEEAQELRMMGLIKYSAEDYVNELLGHWAGRSDGELTSMASPWI